MTNGELEKFRPNISTWAYPDVRLIYSDTRNITLENYAKINKQRYSNILFILS